MSNPMDDFAQRKLVPFKSQIGYDKIVANLGPEIQYIVDWVNLLSEFIDAEGETWKPECLPHYHVSGLHGTEKINLISAQNSISIEIHKVGGGQRSAVDTALRIVSSGSAKNVSMQYVPSRCPADFCLMSEDADEIDRMYMVKGNLLIILDSFESHSVLPVAKYISEAMEKRKIDPQHSPLNKVKLGVKVDRGNIKEGENVVFSVEPHELFDDEEWLIDVRPLKEGELSYVKDESGKFTYKALKKGALTILVNVMHKRTLQVKQESHVAHVN
jgi:hypothetical protein